MPKDNLDLEAVGQSVVEVQKAFDEFKKTVDARDKENLKKGSADVLFEEKLQRLTDDILDHQKELDKLYAATKRTHITLDGKPVNMDELDQKALDWARGCAKRQGTVISDYKADNLKEYKAAFSRYLRKDDAILNSDEKKALSVGSDPDGGYTVDPDTSGRMVEKIFETSPMRQHASVQIISTDSLEGEYDLDEAACGWVTETGSRAETDTPQLGVWRIPVHEMYAAPRATQRVVDDSAINIESWLADKVADKMARTENTAFVDGDGVGKPRGFLSYSSGTTLPGTIERFTTGVNGDFAADPAGADKLISMIMGLKAPYRARANWFMNRTTIGGVMQLKDSNGNMMWQPSLVAGTPSTLLGYGVVELYDMPNYTTTDALAIAFGDMASAYQIVERQGTRVLRDPYSAKPYIIYYTTRRVGGDVLNFEAIKLLEFTA